MKLVLQAECVVAHSGFGVITECIKRKKRLIVVQGKELGECVDDQFEISNYFSSIGLIEVVANEQLLLQQILKVRDPSRPITEYLNQRDALPAVEDNIFRDGA